MIWFPIAIVAAIIFFIVVAYWDRAGERFIDEVVADVFSHEPRWESVPSYDEGELIGYRVRWSQPDDQGRYLWVGHYLAEPDDKDRLRWCEVASESDAKRKNEEGKAPWEYRAMKNIRKQVGGTSE